MNPLTPIFDASIRFQCKYAEHLINRFRYIPIPGARVELGREWVEPRGLTAALVRDPHVVVTGAAGAGKTTTLAYLAISHARDLLTNPNGRVPLFFSGRDLNAHFPRITDLPRGLGLGDALAAQTPRIFFPEICNTGRALILIDDADALAPDQLLGWLQEFKDARVVLAAQTPVQSFGEFTLPGLRDNDIEAFAKNWNAATANSFLAALKSSGVPRSLTTSPLMLGLLARVWRSDQPLPTRRAELFEAYVAQTLGDDDETAKTLEEVALAIQRGRSASNEFLAKAKGFLRAAKNRTVEFPHDLWQAYFAACALREASDPNLLIEHLDDGDWREVILFYAGLGGASELVMALQARNDFVLAGHVLANAKSAREDLRGSVTQALTNQAWDGDTCAIAALSEMHSETAVDAFAAKLKDKDAAVRTRTAEILGQLQLDRGIEYLLPQLRDVNADVRDRVVEALGRSRTDRVVEPLLVALRGDSRVGVVDTRMRVAAAKALGEIASDKALPALIVELQIGEPEVRAAAADALKRISSPLLRKPLEGVLATGDESARAYAVDVLEVVASR